MKLQANLILCKLCVHCPTAVLSSIDLLIEPIEKATTRKISKEGIVGPEVRNILCILWGIFFEVLWGMFFQVSWGTLFLFLNGILFFFLDYDTVDVLVCALIFILFFIYVYLFIIFFTYYFLVSLIIYLFLIFRLNVLWNLYVPVWKQYLRWIDLKIFYWTENGLISWIDFLWTLWRQNYWDH